MLVLLLLLLLLLMLRLMLHLIGIIVVSIRFDDFPFLNSLFCPGLSGYQISGLPRFNWIRLDSNGFHFSIFQFESIRMKPDQCDSILNSSWVNLGLKIPPQDLPKTPLGCILVPFREPLGPF